MAGDWIPVECDTPRKTEVIALSRLTGMSRQEVMGYLVEFWAWVSASSDDGHIGTDEAGLTTLFGAGDLWPAMIEVGWLERNGSGLVVPHAEHWLTNGAKSRLKRSRSQKKYRANKPDEPTPKPKAKRKPKFTPPTLEEVTAYVRERGSPIDPDHFHAYYDTQGWRLANGLKMASWKQAIVTWEKRRASDDKKNKGQGEFRL